MESGKVDEYHGFVKREAKPGAKEAIYQCPVVVIAITPTEKNDVKAVTVGRLSGGY